MVWRRIPMRLSSNLFIVTALGLLLGSTTWAVAASKSFSARVMKVENVVYPRYTESDNQGERTITVSFEEKEPGTYLVILREGNRTLWSSTERTVQSTYNRQPVAGFQKNDPKSGCESYWDIFFDPGMQQLVYVNISVAQGVPNSSPDGAGGAARCRYHTYWQL